MKKLALLLLTLMLLLSLAACGGEPAAEEPEAAPAPEAAPELVADAVIDPEEMEWGYESYAPEADDDAQHWYVDGVKNDASYIYFQDIYLTTVEGANEEMYDFEIIDKHIVDYETKGEVFDFVFPDIFTCCDLVSGVWYMRGDYDTLVAELTGSIFYCEAGDQWSYTFNDDGTMVYDNDGELFYYDWWFVDNNTVDFEDADGNGVWVTINYVDGTWEIESIEDVDLYYPE